MTASRPPTMRWRPTASFVIAVAAAGTFTTAAVALDRADAAVFAVPFLIIVAWSLLTAPTGQPAFTRELSTTVAQEGTAQTLTVHVTGAATAEQLTTVIGDIPTVRVEPGRHGVTSASDGAATGTARWTPERWGMVRFGGARAALFTPWSSYRYGPVTFSMTTVRVTPRAEIVAVNAAVPQPLGMTGRNRSRHRGDGSEYADIRPFVQGDSLRRIHWSSSARSGELHVRTTFADEDAELLLVLDASTDFAMSTRLSDVASSLDQGVRAMAGISADLLARGERVGMAVIGGDRAGHVPPRSGSLQQRRILDTLAEVRARNDRYLLQELQRLRCSPGALLIVVTPMLSEQVLAAAAGAVRRGSRVLVVDCLPAGSQHPSVDEPLLELAFRIRLMQRDTEIRAIRDLGVPVGPWGGAGSLDPMLRQLNRRPSTAGPR